MPHVCFALSCAVGCTEEENMAGWEQLSWYPIVCMMYKCMCECVCDLFLWFFAIFIGLVISLSNSSPLTEGP